MTKKKKYFNKSVFTASPPAPAPAPAPQPPAPAPAPAPQPPAPAPAPEPVAAPAEAPAPAEKKVLVLEGVVAVFPKGVFDAEDGSSKVPADPIDAAGAGLVSIASSGPSFRDAVLSIGAASDARLPAGVDPASISGIAWTSAAADSLRGFAGASSGEQVPEGKLAWVTVVGQFSLREPAPPPPDYSGVTLAEAAAAAAARGGSARFFVQAESGPALVAVASGNEAIKAMVDALSSAEAKAGEAEAEADA